MSFMISVLAGPLSASRLSPVGTPDAPPFSRKPSSSSFLANSSTASGVRAVSKLPTAQAMISSVVCPLNWFASSNSNS